MCVFTHTWNLYFKKDVKGYYGKGKGTDVSMVRSKYIISCMQILMTVLLYNYKHSELDKKSEHTEEKQKDVYCWSRARS